MKQKHISTQSGKILAYFAEANQDCFDYAEAELALPQSTAGARKELLSDMVRRGLLMRLKKGLYCVIPYAEDPDAFMPNWHLLAAPLTNGTAHYIGYYTALQIHGLIVQPSLKEQIVVAKQIRPSVLTIKNIDFQFIFHNEKHFFGAKKVWIDSYHKVNCSNLEKTLIDCLFKPDYAGGIAEVARAIYMAKTRIDFEQLLEYALRFDSQAVIKRLGYLLEALEIGGGIVDRLQEAKSDSYVLLDTELPDSGKYNTRWSIRQNLDIETIQSSIYT